MNIKKPNVHAVKTRSACLVLFHGTSRMKADAYYKANSMKRQLICERIIAAKHTQTREVEFLGEGQTRLDLP